MKKLNKTFTIFCLALSIDLTLMSCGGHDGFKRDSSGFLYKFHEENPGLPQPETGDFVEINIAIHTGENEISPMTHNSMTIDESVYRGDLYSALKTMHLGDSATFIFKGRKFYEKFLNMGEYPYGKEPIFADVKMVKIMSKSKIELAEENFKENKKRLRHIEDSLIADYVVEHRIEKKKNGIYRIFNKKNDGETPKKGQTVEILFHAYRLDGTEFDSVTDPEHPRSFQVGAEQVAKGIDEIVQQMHVGDDVTCVLPSRKAFGEAGSEFFNIPPYTPVVYRIELLRIVK